MSLPIDGSADHEISVKGLQNLEVGDWTRVPVEEPAAKRRDKGRKKVIQSKNLGQENSGCGNSRRENEDFEMSTLGDEDDRIEYIEKDKVL